MSKNKKLDNVLLEIAKKKELIAKINTINYNSFEKDASKVIDILPQLTNNDDFKVLNVFNVDKKVQYKKYSLYKKFNIFMYIEGFKRALEIMGETFISDAIKDDLYEQSI